MHSPGLARPIDASHSTVGTTCASCVPTSWLGPSSTPLRTVVCGAPRERTHHGGTPKLLVVVAGIHKHDDALRANACRRSPRQLSTRSGQAHIALARPAPQRALRTGDARQQLARDLAHGQADVKFRDLGRRRQRTAPSQVALAVTLVTILGLRERVWRADQPAARDTQDWAVRTRHVGQAQNSRGPHRGWR